MPDSSPHIKRNGLDEIASRSDLTRIVVFYRQEGDHQRYVEYHPDTLRQLVEQLEAERTKIRLRDSALRGLEEQLEAARTALELVGAIQRTRLGWYRDQGVVFKSKLNGDPDPDDWESIAFWTYTDLCEVESIARAALEESNPASRPESA